MKKQPNPYKELSHPSTSTFSSVSPLCPSDLGLPQGLCTCRLFYLNEPPATWLIPRATRLILHCQPVFAPLSPFKEAFPEFFIYNDNTAPLPATSQYMFLLCIYRHLSAAHMNYAFIPFMAPEPLIECKLHVGRNFCMLCSLLYFRCLQQCLTHIRRWISICWKEGNEISNLIAVEPRHVGFSLHQI